MKKKVLLILLAVVSALTMSIGLVGCKSDKPTEKVEIVGWADSTEQVVLGTTYEVQDATAVDKNGKEYKVEVSVVKKTDGGNVSLIFGAFDILSIDGYEVVYKATENGEIKAQKKISLTVKDEGLPVVMISGNNIASVGEKFAYPAINVSDDSGIVASKEISVYDSEGNAFASDAEGFTPDKIGEYVIKVSAKDGAGNSGSSSYVIYARDRKLANEIDCFDDIYLSFTSYVSDGKTKTNAQLAPFGFTSDSKGSAYFVSNTAASTDFYVQPRNDASMVAAVGENAYISVRLYIADNAQAERTIVYGNKDKTVKTNEWIEIKITSEEVGNVTRFVNNLSLGTNRLFGVYNTVNSFVCFVDKVTVTNESESAMLSGVNDHYESGVAVNVTVNSNAKLDLYYAGKAVSVENGFVPENDGEYTLIAKSADGKLADEAYSFTVGNVSVKLNTTARIVKNKNAVMPTVKAFNDNAETTATTTYYYIDENGAAVKIDGEYIASGEYLGIITESVCGDKTVKSFTVLLVNRFAENAWFAMDDESVPEQYKNVENFAFHKDFTDKDGTVLHNVAELKIVKTDGTFSHLRQFWTAVYPKEYYEQFNYLVIRARGTALKSRLAYIGEEPWTSITVSNEVTQEWRNYYIKMEDIMKDFDNLSKYCLTWQDASDGTASLAGESIYISEMYCIKLEDLPSNTWFNTDNEVSVAAAQSHWKWYEKFDGEDGVVEFAILGQGAGQNVNGWYPVYSEEFYKNCDVLTFRIKADKNVLLTYGTSDPWQFPVVMNLTQEWQDLSFSLSDILAGTAFSNYIAQSCFWCGGAEGETFKIYVADVSVSKSLTVKGSYEKKDGNIVLSDDGATVFADFDDVVKKVYAGSQEVELSGDGNTFAPIKYQSNYTVKYVAMKDGIPYVGSYTIYVDAEEARLYDFNDGNLTAGSAGNVSYDTTEKAVKINIAPEANFAWLLRGKMALDKATASKYTKITFSVKTTAAPVSVRLYSEAAADGWDYGYVISVSKANEYVEYTFDISNLIAHYTDLNNQFMLYVEETTEILINNIYLSGLVTELPETLSVLDLTKSTSYNQDEQAIVINGNGGDLQWVWDIRNVALASKEDLSNYSKLVIRVKVSEVENKPIEYFHEDLWSNCGYVIRPEVAGEYVDYEFDIKKFLDNYDTYITRGCLLLEGGTSTYYIQSIYATGLKSELPETLSVWDMSECATGNYDSATIAYDSEVGALKILKDTAFCGWTFKEDGKLKVDAEAVSNYTKLNFKVKTDSQTAFKLCAWAGGEGDTPEFLNTWGKFEMSVVASGEWQIFTFDIANFRETLEHFKVAGLKLWASGLPSGSYAWVQDIYLSK